MRLTGVVSGFRCSSSIGAFGCFFHGDRGGDGKSDLIDLKLYSFVIEKVILS